MGTETHLLQKEIKSLIKRLGLSQKRLARVLDAMDEDGDWATEKDVNQYEERLKKHLSRSTVSPELLQRYLQQIQRHQEFAKLNVVVPYALIDEDFSEEFVQGMRLISAMLDEQ